MIIGGGHIYEEFLPSADRIYLTRVHADVDGDAYLPVLSDAEWAVESEETHAADDDNDYETEFVVLNRTSRT